MVQGRGLFRDRCRMAQWQQIDSRRDGQPIAAGGDLRQLQERVEDRRGEGDMVADPDCIELEFVELCRDRPCRRQIREPRHQTVMVGLAQGQAHIRSSVVISIAGTFARHTGLSK